MEPVYQSHTIHISRPRWAVATNYFSRVCILIGLGFMPYIHASAQSLVLQHFSFSYYHQATRFGALDYQAFLRNAPYAPTLPSPSVYQQVGDQIFHYRQTGLAIVFGFDWQTGKNKPKLAHGLEIGLRNGFERPGDTETGPKNVALELTAIDSVPYGQQGHYIMALRGNNLGISLGYSASPLAWGKWLQVGAAYRLDLPVSKNLESYAGGEFNRQLIHSYFMSHKYAMELQAYAQVQWKILYLRYGLGYHYMAIERMPMGQNTRSFQLGLKYQI